MYHINSYHQSIRSLKMGTLRGTWMNIRRNNQWMSTSGVEWYCMILQSVGCYDMLSYDWQVKRSCQRTVKHKETVQRSFLKNTHLHPPTEEVENHCCLTVGGMDKASECHASILLTAPWAILHEVMRLMPRGNMLLKYHYIDRKGKGYPCV